ncbi:MAG: hypothetical protein N2747_04935 [Chitinophagaceae bacterium]|nr:hypothetical protein [Chitinophagaceae bacterium]
MYLNLFIAFFFVTYALLGYGQSYESSIQYDKKKQAALAIEYPFQPQAVENAFIEKMARLGYKAKEEKGLLNRDKGFLLFKNAYIADISNERTDFYIKVERKSRKEKDESVLYMIMLRGDQNVLNSSDILSINNAKTFLNNLLPDVEAANLELEIKAAEERLAKTEKKLRDLREEQASLEKKLQQNRTDQENTQKEIETQKQALSVLQGKRKSKN